MWLIANKPLKMKWKTFLINASYIGITYVFLIFTNLFVLLREVMWFSLYWRHIYLIYIVSIIIVYNLIIYFFYIFKNDFVLKKRKYAKTNVYSFFFSYVIFYWKLIIVTSTGI